MRYLFIFIAALLLTPELLFSDTEIGAGAGLSPWDSSFREEGDKAPRPQDAYVKAIAAHFNADTEALMKLWHRGYGRNELIKLLIICSNSGAPLSELVKARDKNTKLFQLCDKYDLTYENILSEASSARSAIDAKAALVSVPASAESVKTSSGTYSLVSSTAAAQQVSPSTGTKKY